MAYARWNGESDVYFISDGETFQCVACCPGILNRRAALAHLQQHRINGDRVPDYATKRLKEEIRRGFN